MPDGTMITAESQGMSEPRIIIFVKAPRPGFVKTRLGDDIGPKNACDAYCKLVNTLLDSLTDLPHVELRFTPDDAESEISQWLCGGWTAVPQGEGDLGQRMHRAIGQAKCPAIVIGSDCPSIRLTDISDAREALDKHDVVLGPAVDGGYWLIGLQVPCPALFDGIQWSANNVLKETLARSEKAGLSVYLLRELADVDTAEDWAAYNK
mgnify:CR=1 FL=1